MNINTEFCNMKTQTQHNTNKISLILIIGGLITSSLFLLNYFNIIYLDLEVVLAPFLVITLLTFGDKLLILLFLSPINFAAKLISKERISSQSQKQITLKQS